MPFTGAMRAWATGQIVLVTDVALAAGLGLAQRSTGGVVLTAPFAVMLAALLAFFVPLAVAVAVPSLRRHAALWALSAVPAVLWIPAIPALFLRAGPDLGSPVGVGLAGAAVVGAVLVVVGAGVAMIESAVRRSEPELAVAEPSAVFVDETEVAEPEAAESEAAGSEAAEPMTTEPEALESPSAEPEAAELEVAEPEAAESEAAEEPQSEPISAPAPEPSAAEAFPSSVDAEVALLAREDAGAAEPEEPATTATIEDDVPS